MLFCGEKENCGIPATVPFFLLTTKSEACRLPVGLFPHRVQVFWLTVLYSYHTFPGIAQWRTHPIRICTSAELPDYSGGTAQDFHLFPS